MLIKWTKSEVIYGQRVGQKTDDEDLDKNTIPGGEGRVGDGE